MSVRSVQAVGRHMPFARRRGLASLDNGHAPLAGMKVKQARLMNDIHNTCEWGKGYQWGTGKHETGMARLALSDSDKQVRDWFVDTARSLGCRVYVDAMGNIFAVRPGRRKGFPPTCAGSHLDTQPTGGRYDGILGNCAGVEMLRVLHEEKTETEFPVGVVNWTKYA
ncbi:MAG: hypothetical protein LQ350_007293 [Teloschistes chrysophthalmus]|nr:MAG: hypothetical protein LQ350_007293 [Niorma chrysophthalma]